MQFKCPKCAARYEIANEKVPTGKTLRFSCKKCGAGIRLRRKVKKAEAEESFDGPTEPTGVRAFETQAPAPPKGELSDANWFALVAGRRIGPMPRFELERMIASRDVDGQTYAWCAGMTDWQRLRFIGDFSAELAHLGTAPWRVVMPLDDDDTQADNMPAEVSDKTPEPEPIGTLAQELPREDSVPDKEAAVEEMDELLDELADLSPVDAARAQSAKTGTFDGPTTLAPMDFADLEPPPIPEDGAVDELDLEAPTDRVITPFVADEVSLKQDDDATRVDEPTDVELKPFESGRLVEAIDDATTLGGSQESLPTPTPFDEDVPDINTVREELIDSDLHQIDSFAPAFDTTDREVPLTTDFFMESAGLNRRRRNHRLAMVMSITFTVTLVGIASLDLFGIIELPGMGKFYDVTGLEDPNKGRKIERIEKKLAQAPSNSTDREKLEDLRYKLMGIKRPKKKPKKQNKPKQIGEISSLAEKTPSTTKRRGKVTQVAEITSPDDMFGSLRKKSFSTENFSKTESTVKSKVDSGPGQASLPDGLSQESIYKIIKEKNAAMSMCMNEALKRGEQLKGKMEIELTVQATGRVSQVGIPTKKFKNTYMAGCVSKRIKQWRFPRFRGEAVTVVYPYILQMGF